MYGEDLQSQKNSGTSRTLLFKLTSTLNLNNFPLNLLTSSLFIPRFPVNANLLGIWCACVIVFAIRSSKRHSFVLCAIAWEIASLTIISPDLRVIMSLKIRGKVVVLEYSKWKSSVSKSCSLRGSRIREGRAVGDAKVMSARTS